MFIRVQETQHVRWGLGVFCYHNRRPMREYCSTFRMVPQPETINPLGCAVKCAGSTIQSPGIDGFGMLWGF